MITQDPKQNAANVGAAPEHPPYIWWAGKVTPWEEANVHVTMVGWSGVSAVFEGIRAYWDAEREEFLIFRLDQHMRRFSDSIKFMRMVQTYSAQDIEAAIAALIQANGYRDDAYCQPLAYMGRSVPGYFPADGFPSEVFITTRPAPSNLGKSRVMSGGVSSWARISDNVMPARAKAVTNYQNSRYVSNEAQLHGHDIGLILNDRGKVAEGSYACVFIVRNGVAITPAKTQGILESITRDSLIEMLHEMGVATEEREVDRTELYVADEVFLCGTLMEIAAVGSVDHYKVGEGAMGPLTKTLEQRFEQVVRRKDERYAHWLTPVPVKAAAPSR